MRCRCARARARARARADARAAHAGARACRQVALNARVQPVALQSADGGVIAPLSVLIRAPAALTADGLEVRAAAGLSCARAARAVASRRFTRS